MSIKITRQKRPDRVICKWKGYEISLGEDNYVCLREWGKGCEIHMYFPLSEIPNLIKALLEVSKESK